MSLGATHYEWDVDVHRIVIQVRRRFPELRANTYRGHPLWWPPYKGKLWERRSFDLWGVGGRGDPAPREVALASLRFLRQLPGAPYIRHHIFENQLWTSFGGYSYYAPEDHDGPLQHVHLTYW